MHACMQISAESNLDHSGEPAATWRHDLKLALPTTVAPRIEVTHSRLRLRAKEEPRPKSTPASPVRSWARKKKTRAKFSRPTATLGLASTRRGASVRALPGLPRCRRRRRGRAAAASPPAERKENRGNGARRRRGRGRDGGRGGGRGGRAQRERGGRRREGPVRDV